MFSFLAACSPLQIVDHLTPKTGYERVQGIPYAEGPRQTYDLYEPSAPRRDAPAIVYFYGGGWKSGDKDKYRFVAQSLTKAGYTVAIPDYRLYPQVTFPDFVQDGAAAVAAVAARLDRPIVLMGHSAGAHIAMMLTLDPRWLSAAGLDVDSTVKATVGLSGPYDFLPLSDDLQPILAPQGDPEASQPITYARGDAPPLLLLHGTADTTVLPKNTKNLAAAIAGLGGDVTVKTYPKVGHAPMIGAFAPALDFLAPSRADVLAWLRDRGL
ncbi:alpha/beta hydrolase [Thalassobaculum sp. OXR-137]|uniref:alpha/beta hydrolase n=1 Tax=Thalassobaculum sp. OXR-137 TaxID=3100173 RepID=UPI002AC97036|nr:alpha/beta hydrolase [Thalassobaculum sp. OXR-137]WPZ32471.1 alpha/beta hydrolase [Thalassobaculum sp. OXR-137]